MALPQVTPIFTPLIFASAQIQLPPKYSGKIADWLNFKSRWELWVQTMSARDGVDDPLVFENLAQVLDDGEATNLRILRGENPALTYKKYWAGLVREKERYVGQSLRQSLENLCLESKGKVTPSKCKEYTAQFRSIKGQNSRIFRRGSRETHPTTNPHDAGAKTP